MNRRARLAIAGIGTVLVAVYATLMVLIIQVLNPLYAAPGLTLADIAAAAASQNEPIFTPFPIVVAGGGIALALAIMMVAILGRGISTWAVGMAYLVILVLGAPVYFVTSFGPGMSVADTFVTGGGDHTGLEPYLYITSLLALAALAIISAASVLIRAARSTRAFVEPVGPIGRAHDASMR